MMFKEPKIIEFNNSAEYNKWHITQYQSMNGIKECGLVILDDGRVSVSYIKLGDE